MDSEIVSTSFLFPFIFLLLPTYAEKLTKFFGLNDFFLLLAQLHKRLLVNVSFKYHVVSNFCFDKVKGGITANSFLFCNELKIVYPTLGNNFVSIDFNDMDEHFRC